MSKLSRKVARETVFLSADDPEMERAIDAVLKPVRECLERAEHLMRAHGFNIERKELLTVLEDLKTE